MAWSQAASWAGGGAGSSTWSRKKSFRVRDARCCHPCLHSPGSAVPSSRSGGRAPCATSSQSGTSVQPSAASSPRAAEAVRRHTGPRASARQGTAQSVKVGHRSRSTVRAWGQAALQDTAGAVRVACDSPTAKASREESDVPSGTCLLFRSSTQTGLESAPKAASCVAAYGATRSGETVRSACLARGAAQKLRRSHARTVGRAVGEAGGATRLRLQVFWRPRRGRTLACRWGCRVR